MIAPSDSVVQQGNTVFFTCVAHGAILPDISWHRNESGPLQDGANVTITTTTITVGEFLYFTSSILELCGVDSAYEGEYFCEATYESNPDARSVVYFSVDVLEPDGV